MSIQEYLSKLEPKDVATLSGVAISLVGFIVNLIFNVANYRRTSAVRDDTLRLDEFKRLRTPVDAAVLDIRSSIKTLRSLEASGSSVAKILKEIVGCNKALAETYDQLCDALGDLDRSQLVTGTAWLNDIPDAWDDVYTAFNAAYVRGKDLAALRGSIHNIIHKLDVLVAVIHHKLDAEIH